MHAELMSTAKRLLCSAEGETLSPTDLRRSASTAYYALFHFVSSACVASLLGNSTKNLTRARMQAYRSLDHRDIEAACAKAQKVELDFPAEIKSFASVFVRMRKAREKADYDLSSSEFNLPYVEHLIGQCEAVMVEFEEADNDDKKAFAILMTLRSKSR